MTADHDDLIREAEERLAEANAEVARLRAQLATEQADEKRRLTAEDGRAEARRRIAQRTGKAGRDAQADPQKGTGTATGVASQTAAGVAEARRRRGLPR